MILNELIHRLSNIPTHLGDAEVVMPDMLPVTSVEYHVGTNTVIVSDFVDEDDDT